jgi:hypothetical protein
MMQASYIHGTNISGLFVLCASSFTFFVVITMQFVDRGIRSHQQGVENLLTSFQASTPSPTKIPTIIDPSATREYLRTTGPIIVGIRVENTLALRGQSRNGSTFDVYAFMDTLIATIIDPVLGFPQLLTLVLLKNTIALRGQ